jgi:hypothetical protein
MGPGDEDQLRAVKAFNRKHPLVTLPTIIPNFDSIRPVLEVGRTTQSLGVEAILHDFDQQVLP